MRSFQNNLFSLEIDQISCLVFNNNNNGMLLEQEHLARVTYSEALVSCFVFLTVISSLFQSFFFFFLHCFYLLLTLQEDLSWTLLWT